MRKCSAVEDFARRGACPPLGAGGAWQNPPCQLAVPSHNSGYSYLRVPAPAGTSDWYENTRLPKRRQAPSFPRKRESRGEGWHQPHPNPSIDQCTQFSYLRVPAPAGDTSRKIRPDDTNSGPSGVAPALVRGYLHGSDLQNKTWISRSLPHIDPTSNLQSGNSEVCYSERYLESPWRVSTYVSRKVEVSGLARVGRMLRDAGRRHLPHRQFAYRTNPIPRRWPASNRRRHEQDHRSYLESEHPCGSAGHVRRVFLPD